IMELRTIVDSPNTISQWTHDALVRWGVPVTQVSWVNLCVMVVLLFVVLCIVDYVVRHILLNLLTAFAKRSTTKFDDHLVRNKAMAHAARLVPLIIATQFIPTVFADFPTWRASVRKFMDILLVVGWVLLFRAFFRSVRDHLRTKKGFEDKPLDSY